MAVTPADWGPTQGGLILPEQPPGGGLWGPGGLTDPSGAPLGPSGPGPQYGPNPIYGPHGPQSAGPGSSAGAAQSLRGLLGVKTPFQSLRMDPAGAFLNRGPGSVTAGVQGVRDTAKAGGAGWFGQRFGTPGGTRSGYFMGRDLPSSGIRESAKNIRWPTIGNSLKSAALRGGWGVGALFGANTAADAFKDTPGANSFTQGMQVGARPGAFFGPMVGSAMMAGSGFAELAADYLPGLVGKKGDMDTNNVGLAWDRSAGQIPAVGQFLQVGASAADEKKQSTTGLHTTDGNRIGYSDDETGYVYTNDDQPVPYDDPDEAIEFLRHNPDFGKDLTDVKGSTLDGESETIAKLDEESGWLFEKNEEGKWAPTTQEAQARVDQIHYETNTAPEGGQMPMDAAQGPFGDPAVLAQAGYGVDAQDAAARSAQASVYMQMGMGQQQAISMAFANTPGFNNQMAIETRQRNAERDFINQMLDPYLQGAPDDYASSVRGFAATLPERRTSQYDQRINDMMNAAPVQEQVDPMQEQFMAMLAEQ